VKECGLGCETYPKCCKCIRTDFKGSLVDPGEELPEDAIPRHTRVFIDVLPPEAIRFRRGLVVENDDRHVLMLQGLPQHHAAGHGALPMVVASAELRDDLWPRIDDMGYGRGVWRYLVRLLVPKDMREDGLCIFAGLKGEKMDALGEVIEKIFLYD
jgi:hypothetical protein